MHAGDIVGSYRVIRRIGRGGMGAVYLAEHTLIGRKAAIKTLLPKLCSRPAIVHRFFNEAKAAAAVKHPGIVEIYDFGFRDDDTGYIAMEYLAGESLGARLHRDKGMDVSRALEIIRQTASALAAAHARGVIHRDLKPDNIFLAEDPEIGERVKVLDFGVAKLLDFAARDDSSAEPDAANPAESHRTHSGMLLGTPSYMSPEQCKAAGRVDARSDLYSLGCILFVMLCGQPPFVREGFGEVLGAHMYEPPPAPRSLTPSLDPDVESLILQLLAKNPDDRFASASELVAAINDITESPNPPGTRATTGLPATAPGRSPRAHASSNLADPPGTARSATGRRPRHDSPMLAHADHTTLSSASSAVTLEEPSADARTREPSRLRLALFALAGFLSVGLLGITVLGLGGDESPDTQPEAASATDPAASDHKDSTASPAASNALPPSPINPTTIAIRIESTPPGAEVYAKTGGAPLGQTPYVGDHPAQRDKRIFVIKKDGFHDETTVVAGDRDTNAIITLRPTEIETTTQPESTTTTKAETETRPGAKLETSRDKATAATRASTPAVSPKRTRTRRGDKAGKPRSRGDRPPSRKPASKPDRDALKKGGYVDPF